jgi:two-component system sensor histidine kinase RstB
MRNLFTKLYLQFLASFMLAIVVITVTFFSYTQNKLTQFAGERLDPVAELIGGIWQGIDVDERENWLAIDSALSGTQWKLLETAQTVPVQILHTHIQSASVHVRLALDAQYAVELEIDDWPEWEKFMGWLVLSELSNVPANLREAKFQQLKTVMPFALDRVNRQTESLSALDIRQLNNGQAVRITDANVNESTLYFPAGANQVIRMGPIFGFELLSTVQWALLILVSLLSLSLMFSLAVRPVHQRFLALHRAVGRIERTPESVNLPTQHNDQLGDLARRIDALATGLIRQLNANKRLNMAVSHDLKTPLARIKFALALLDESGENPYATQINQDVSLLSELISELLLYHQLTEARASDAQCESIAIVQPVLNAIKPSLNVEQNLPERADLPIAATDWRRIVSNLIGNAEEHAKARVSVSLSINAEHATLTVADDGPGLSQEDFELLKQPFQRASGHRSNTQSHHGLGLALVDATVDHYGGAFTLCETTLPGACFQVVLPYNSATK